MSGGGGGFTLLELLVVLAIAGLVMTVVPPLFSGAIGGVELKDSARRLAAGLRVARSHAIGVNEEGVLSLDVEKRLFTVSGRHKSYSLPQDIDLSLITADTELTGDKSGHIRFFPDGTSTGGQIRLASERQEYVVDVDWLTGRVRIHTEP